MVLCSLIQLRIAAAGCRGSLLPGSVCRSRLFERRMIESDRISCLLLSSQQLSGIADSVAQYCPQDCLFPASRWIRLKLASRPFLDRSAMTSTRVCHCRGAKLLTFILGIDLPCIHQCLIGATRPPHPRDTELVPEDDMEARPGGQPRHGKGPTIEQ
jgi:hypothetical protein